MTKRMKPLAPEILMNALQDRIHKEVGRSRAAKSVKVKAPAQLPCPFCEVDLIHIESVAKSFDPPRIYHEFHHPDNACVLSGYRRVFSDALAPIIQWLKKWNTRP